MANLLDQASIVLTPTAYDNGKVLCAKPSEPPYGDFDFSRNSAATRVNAQGLVENVQILSSNLVQNGDFSEEGAEEVSNGSFSQEGSELITNGDFSSDTAWGKEVGWSISDGSLVANSVTTGLAFQSNIVEANKFYKATYDVVVTSGSIGLYFDGGTGYQGIATTTQTVTVFFKATTASPLYFRSDTSNFTGSIDNVSVREVGQDWALGTGWSIGEDKLNFTNVNGSSNQSSVFVIGKTYKITVDYTFTSGTRFILPYDGTNYNSDMRITTPSSAIGYTYYYTPLVGGTLFTYSDGNGNGSITNISVKEVGQNWEFNSTAILTANGMNITTGGYIRQDVVTIGKSYKLTYDIVSYTSGDIRVYDGTSQGSIPTSVGSNTFNFTAGGSVFVIQSNSASVNLVITNISVIEITDDTNLPRINYEGFSYQDALGSEEVVNGGFDTNLNNWVAYSNTLISWESGGYALLDSNNNFWCKIKQSNVFEIGKTYKVILTAKSDRTDLFFHNSPITGSFSEADTFETFEQYYTATTTDFLFGYANAGSATITIDNVSVKEVTGQEVVPDSGCGSWLWESQSTNLITQSELFSDASWADVGLTINNNASVSPEGASNATKIIATTANSRHELKTSLATANGTDMVSCFVKKSGYNYVQIASWAKPANYVNFDLTNGLVGSIGTTPPTNYGIKDYGNGWYRIYANVQASGGGLVGIGIVTSASAGWAQSFIGNGIDGIEIWGAQIEAGNISSYIPTSGSTVTRNQDVCNNGGSLASINSTSGTLYAEIAALSDVTSLKSLSLSDGTNSNRVTIGIDNGNYYFQIRKQGSIVFGGGGLLNNVKLYNKIAISYAENNFALWINGTKVSTDTSGLTPIGLNQLNFNLGGGSHNFFGKTKALAVWKEALSDAELTELTTI